jgi:hypothetical protein
MRKQKINFPSVKDVPSQIVRSEGKIISIPSAERYIERFDTLNNLKPGGTVVNGKRV